MLNTQFSISLLEVFLNRPIANRWRVGYSCRGFRSGPLSIVGVCVTVVLVSGAVHCQSLACGLQLSWFQERPIANRWRVGYSCLGFRSGPLPIVGVWVTVVVVSGAVHCQSLACGLQLSWFQERSIANRWRVGYSCLGFRSGPLPIVGVWVTVVLVSGAVHCQSLACGLQLSWFQERSIVNRWRVGYSCLGFRSGPLPIVGVWVTVVLVSGAVVGPTSCGAGNVGVNNKTQLVFYYSK